MWDFCLNGNFPNLMQHFRKFALNWVFFGEPYNIFSKIPHILRFFPGRSYSNLTIQFPGFALNSKFTPKRPILGTFAKNGESFSLTPSFWVLPKISYHLHRPNILLAQLEIFEQNNQIFQFFQNGKFFQFDLLFSRLRPEREFFPAKRPISWISPLRRNFIDKWAMLWERICPWNCFLIMKSD